LEKQLHGVITPVVTPLHEDFSLDLQGLERLIEHLIAGGVQGLFMLGTTGEGPHLSHQKRQTIITETLRISNNRLPVLIGVSDTSTEELVDMCHFAKTKGVDAVVLAAPYFAPISQDELLLWMQHVIPKIELPVMLYDLPSHINVKLSIDLVKTVSEMEQVIGIKDSSGDMTYFNMLLSQIKRPDFRFFTGPEILFADSLMAGGHGGVPGGSNLYPTLFTDIYRASQEKDFETLKERQTAVRALYTDLYSVNAYGSGFMCGLHAALEAKGICKNVLMPPYFPHQNKQGVADVLAKLEDQFPFLID